MIQSAAEFVRLRTSDRPEEYGRAASEPAADLVWLEIVTEYPAMKIWVVHNKTVPVSILELLAIDSDENVRIAVAMKRKLTPALFVLLAGDQHEGVRMRIVYNAKTPMAVLQMLASDSDSRIAEYARKRLDVG